MSNVGGLFVRQILIMAMKLFSLNGNRVIKCGKIINLMRLMSNQ